MAGNRRLETGGSRASKPVGGGAAADRSGFIHGEKTLTPWLRTFATIRRILRDLGFRWPMMFYGEKMIAIGKVGGEPKARNDNSMIRIV